ncbi:Flp pilus assembly protein CpaB [Aeromicrobium sp. A1-2]|uniref:Flp pilus assembly protein CpaB n=1 Tax=Aeromicrobium sp. A1-2 TaxID=2107713 RepID=UPI000E508097|nr:Flp pilus assembly protein CpaB [Aeromicrobium sp. A1-2]AXT85882.1 Flp pilus assembly protein CpaB [Aeromicrobium sp. A1-2]
MNKRVIAAVSAGVLALLGVLVLVVWAQGANDRAFEGAKLVAVVRLTDTVGPSTSATDLASKTEVVKLPDEAVPEGAVTSLDDVAGSSTNASIQKGEVLLASRMSAPGDKVKTSNVVPKGLQEISIALDAEHSVAGAVKAGDRVGVIITIAPDGGKERFTNATLDQVLVTKSSTAVGAGEDGKITGSMITLALKSGDAELLAHGQKWGTVWLTLQNSDTDTSSGRVLADPDLRK